VISQISVAARIGVLDVTADHALAVMALPDLHGEPFDRLLIARSREEPMHFITHDPMLQRYDPSISLA